MRRPTNGRRSAPSEADATAAAAYIGELSGNLAAIARDHGLQTLAYLLDLARLEAANGGAMGQPED